MEGGIRGEVVVGVGAVSLDRRFLSSQQSRRFWRYGEQSEHYANEAIMPLPEHIPRYKQDGSTLILPASILVFTLGDIAGHGELERGIDI